MREYCARQKLEKAISYESTKDAERMKKYRKRIKPKKKKSFKRTLEAEDEPCCKISACYDLDDHKFEVHYRKNPNLRYDIPPILISFSDSESVIKFSKN